MTMTYSSSGPSLTQVLDADLSTSSQSSSTLTETQSLSSSPFDLHTRSGTKSSPRSHSHHRNHHSHPDTDIKRSSSHTHLHSNHAHLHHLKRKKIETAEARVSEIEKESQPKDQLEKRTKSIDVDNRSQQPNRGHLDSGRLPTNPDIKARQAEPSLVTQVVQTISLVQIVDSTGSPIELQTHYAPPATVVVDSASGITIAVANPNPSLPAATPASNPVATDNVPEASKADATVAPSAESPDMNSTSPNFLSQDTTVSQAVPDPATDDTTASVTDAVKESSGSLQETSPWAETDVDTSSFAAVPTTSVDPALTDLSGAQNTTAPATTTADDSTTSTLEPSTLTETTEESTSEVLSDTATATDIATTGSYSSVFKNALSTSTDDLSTDSTTSTQASSVTSSPSSESDYSTDYSSSVYTTISTETWTSTWWENGDEEGSYGDVTSVVQPPASSTSAASEEAGTLSTTQKQVIGGVVGSVAGVAFVALLILLLFRNKRKNGGSLLGSIRPRGLTGDGGSGTQTGAMTETSRPFSLGTALAGLTGKNKVKEPEAAAGGERGFYRVSGRKLPSVLQAGGDGYTDPRGDLQQGQANRESVASGQSDYWRGSQAFDPDNGGLSHLTLGSPMRPVSGVPIIRSGPARTPVKEENPFADPPPRPRPDSEALAGSIGSGSVASRDGSRFQERI